MVLCSYRKVGSGVVDCVTALRYKKLTNEEGLGRKKREEERPQKRKRKRKQKGP